MNKIFKFFPYLIVYFLSLQANLVWGFTLAYPNEAHFPTPQIKLDVAGDDCTQAGFNSSVELLNMAQKAVDEYWNRIPTCALEISKGSVRSGVEVQGDSLDEAVAKVKDNTILIGCSTHNQLFGTHTLALASIDVNRPSRGIVLINNRSSRFANLSEREKWATIAHEIGHAFGLGHSADPVSLMYYSIGKKIQEKLSMDDYDACTYLYPHSSPVSCSSVVFWNGFKKQNIKVEKEKRAWPFWFSLGLGLVIIFLIPGKILKPFHIFFLHQ